MSIHRPDARSEPDQGEVDPFEPDVGAVLQEPIPGTESTIKLGLPGFTTPERTLPFRKADLTRLLANEPGLDEGERARFLQFAKILGATLNHEFYLRLHELKELYAPLDPDSEYVDLHDHSVERREDSDERFLDRLDETLVQANYRPLTLDTIEQAITAPNERGLNYVPDFSLFEHLRIYVRGHIQIRREYRGVNTKFRRKMVTLDAHRRMVVALKFRPDEKRLGPFVSPDVLYLRMFKDVPHVDMEMHLPEQGTRVRMRWIDKAQIASPLFTGIPTVLVKFLLAASMSPFMVLGLLAAPITAGVNSFFGYHRAKRNHLYAMIHRLYYLTIANNNSVLTRLVDSASDEEYKEALIAYFFLWRATSDPEHWDIQHLDTQVESFLKERTGVALDYEVSDAMRKLFRLDLAFVDPAGELRARPIEEALSLLDRRWDDTFRFDGVLDDH